MNWKRIWSGTLVSGLTIWLLDVLAQWAFLKNIGMSHQMMPPNLFSIPIVLAMLEAAFVDGFFCSWLYAVIRPRFGPGPRTAIIAASAIFFIKQGLTVFALSVLWTFYIWFKLFAATYLSGWQYIEKAP